MIETKMEKKVKLRGEHIPNFVDYINGLRLHWVESTGYNMAFAKKHDEIIADMLEDDNTIITIVEGIDDICNCGVCPKLGPRCSSEETTTRDRSISARYGLTIGSVHKLPDLLKLLENIIKQK